MSTFTKYIKNLKNKLFAKEPQGKPSPPKIADSEEPKHKAVEKSKPPVTDKKASEQKKVVEKKESGQKKREPYFIQIGFDFGTSFSKCVCRDVITDRAWVFIPENTKNQELPFLLPCTLSFKNGIINHINNPKIQYEQNSLYHLKNALVKVALSKWDDPILNVYRYAGYSDHHSFLEPKEDWLKQFVELCGIYYFACSFGSVKKMIKSRFHGFGNDDRIAINLAVPVAEAEVPEIEKLFNEVLIDSWILADKMTGYTPVNLKELEQLKAGITAQERKIAQEACFIYPEVSANMQGFVRSRVSSPGIYMFSDAGAGTVDQCTFIFIRNENGDHLNYLHGSVLPLGSSYIEQFAAKISGKTDTKSLELWRLKKEQNATSPELQEARRKIEDKLSFDTNKTLAYTKRRLFVRDQLEQVRVLFGGGGHTEVPYQTGAMGPFTGTHSLFSRELTPDIIGLPMPRDLELNQTEERWIKRLYVAYGLSYEKSLLATFSLPKEGKIPEPHEIWEPHRPIDDPPTMDDV